MLFVVEVRQTLLFQFVDNESELVEFLILGALVDQIDLFEERPDLSRPKKTRRRLL